MHSRHIGKPPVGDISGKSVPVGRPSEDELDYLKSYAEAPDACVILAHDEGILAGAANGIPFIHEGAQMAAIAGSRYNIENLYYVGELLFYPAYRNKGLGLQLLADLVLIMVTFFLPTLLSSHKNIAQHEI